MEVSTYKETLPVTVATRDRRTVHAGNNTPFPDGEWELGKLMLVGA